MRYIMNTYEKVFQEPKGFPPIRIHDHAFNLVLGNQPTNIRPYTYPQPQKNEIEKLIHEIIE